MGYGINTVVDGVAMWGLGVGYIGASGCTSVLCNKASYLYFDFLSLAMLFLLFAVAARKHSILRGLQATSVMLMLLPVEIYLSDRVEFNINVTSFQRYFGVVPWFTNADLLLTALVVFSGAVVLEVWPRLLPREVSAKGGISTLFSRDYVLTAIKYALAVAPIALANLGLLFCFTHYAHVWYLFSEVIAAALTTMPFLFMLKKIRLLSINRPSDVATKPAKNFSINVVGILLNWTLLFLLTSRLGVFYVLSELLATVLVFGGWSFPMNVFTKVVDLPRRDAQTLKARN